MQKLNRKGLKKLPGRSKVQKAQKEDIKGMLELNYKIYPPEWHVSEDYVELIMSKNSEVYNVLRTDKGIKGVVSLFPLDKTSYEHILQGKIEERELAEHLLDYSIPREVYLYLISIIVDIHDPRRKEYAKEIILSIPDELRRIERLGIKVKEIGAIAISPEGKNVLQRIGFHQEQKMEMYGSDFPIFKASVQDVLRAIKVSEKD